jgi:hypothetical protein
MLQKYSILKTGDLVFEIIWPGLKEIYLPPRYCRNIADGLIEFRKTIAFTRCINLNLILSPGAFHPYLHRQNLHYGIQENGKIRVAA